MDTTITLTNQTNLFLTGVEKVFNVCPTELILQLGDQKLVVEGEGMEVQRVDLENKILIVEGKVCAIKYVKPRQPFLKKMFK